MSDCLVCGMKEEKNLLLYEDDKTFAFLHPSPCTAGHIVLAGKDHKTILEQIPDFVVKELFAKANKLSVALFESLGAEGTNIIMQNGIAAGQHLPHATVHIIPRRMNDGLNLLWKPKQLSEDEMSTAELKLKEGAKNIGEFEKEAPKPKEIKEEKISAEEDYRMKHLKRIP